MSRSRAAMTNRLGRSPSTRSDKQGVGRYHAAMRPIPALLLVAALGCSDEEHAAATATSSSSTGGPDAGVTCPPHHEPDPADEAACVPILPASCGPGTMAIGGERDCAP